MNSKSRTSKDVNARTQQPYVRTEGFTRNGDLIV